MIPLALVLLHCPIVDRDHPPELYPYYHNTVIEQPLRKIDANNFPAKVPLDECIKNIFKKEVK